VGEVAIAVRKERNTHDRYIVAWDIYRAKSSRTARSLPGPRLGFLLGDSAEGIQRIGSGSSTRSKKFVILADLFTRESEFWACFLIMRHLLQFF